MQVDNPRPKVGPVVFSVEDIPALYALLKTVCKRWGHGWPSPDALDSHWGRILGWENKLKEALGYE